MTLHWWMHWFWVTSLITLHASIGTAAPQSEELLITTDQPDLPSRGTRQPKALYHEKTSTTTTLIPLNITENHTEKDAEPHTENIPTIANTTDIVHPSIVTASLANSSETYTKAKANETEDSVTDGQNTTLAPKKRNLTRPDVVKDERNVDAAESRIFTEKPLSLETTYQQTRIPPNIESSRRVIDQNDNGMDTGAIAGISFAALVLVALAGSTAFVMYRRRYLNKPQTLNDKCSNPDSSGYLDDSTIRVSIDNSEEMYSLDNDSFLNSLEAMTIQNYWTDTVKHTKL